MNTKTLITCGQIGCDHNFDGYCRRRNIHISSKDKTCDVYNERAKSTTENNSKK